ncbi:hypothetical protein BATDEDRAFT_30401 [Batrachochytrium dendrobatidis JAM81]|uniref:Uncharacterized protein n=1 Tax=Batrachochytrium dendrobatidis (strain JAM81 / FGSC 10211) TaxID=684364 RepID=F4P7K8_BATDJ|nr:uncharacterized protein BATDEDRAFT_30401 [Batrachochytrium dendrobatidis JAM81]EGF79147.1 hypothetical protein BATDEDRAFT_30401 [Batrachochytrium dendrobatidis JAM81]|eukprot:XP_006680380.1 hypothetical protein BATDEDRAFT_30401 [Batrachochytrium dendrobatidis JAM81]
MGKRVNCRTRNLYCELVVKSDNLHSRTCVQAVFCWISNILQLAQLFAQLLVYQSNWICNSVKQIRSSIC